jgi:hypothetical protein
MSTTTQRTNTRDGGTDTDHRSTEALLRDLADTNLPIAGRCEAALERFEGGER